MEKVNEFKKSIVLNDMDFKLMLKCIDMLMSCMKESNENNNQHLEFFQLRLKDRDENPRQKELVLKWATTDNTA